jgi:hypothetical protein
MLPHRTPRLVGTNLPAASPTLVHPCLFSSAVRAGPPFPAQLLWDDRDVVHRRFRQHHLLGKHPFHIGQDGGSRGGVNLTFLQKLAIVPDSDSYYMWVKPSPKPYFKVYIFNYTNVPEFESKEADKLNVKELGPYVYEYVAGDVVA